MLYQNNFEPLKLSRPHGHKNDIMLTWMMGSICNYACSYCPDRLHDGRYTFPDSPRNIIKFLEQLMIEQKNSKIFMEILGGEPTYWKHLSEFAHFCKENHIYLDLVTNGYRDLNWWKKTASAFGAISFSFHSESASEEHYLELIPLVSEQTQTSVSIMMKPDNFQELEEFAYKLQKAAPSVRIALKPLRINMQKLFFKYTDDQKIIMKKPILPTVESRWKLPYSTSLQVESNTGEVKRFRCSQLLLDGLNEFKDWACMAGTQRMFIDIDGKIMPAGCNLDPIGNLNDDEYQFLKEPIVCPHERCVCIWDLYTEKFKI